MVTTSSDESVVDLCRPVVLKNRVGGSCLPRKPSPRRITHVRGGSSQLPCAPVRTWSGVFLPLSSSLGSLLRVWAPASSCEGAKYTQGTATLEKER